MNSIDPDTYFKSLQEQGYTVQVVSSFHEGRKVLEIRCRKGDRVACSFILLDDLVRCTFPQGMMAEKVHDLIRVVDAEERTSANDNEQ